MRRVRAALLTLLCLVLLPAIGWAAELVPVPALSSRVTDLTGTLDETQRGRLEAQLAAIDRSGHAQIAVLLLPSTQPEAIEAFGIRLAEAWKIGHKGVDNGVIVIVAKNDRKMRIEVGYGLEGSIPDAVARRIIAERMAPLFKQGDFFGGLRAAIEALDQAIGGPSSDVPDTPTESAPADGSSNARNSDAFPWLIAAVAGGGVLHMIFGIFGSLIAAGIAGWLGFVIFGSWLAALLTGLAILVLSFFNLLPLLGGGGGGGGGSSSGGGFSGGGGSFGGGGASGGW